MGAMLYLFNVTFFSFYCHINPFINVYHHLGRLPSFVCKFFRFVVLYAGYVVFIMTLLIIPLLIQLFLIWDLFGFVSDLECIFTVICNLVKKPESLDESLEIAKILSTKIAQQPSEKPALRLKM